MVSEFKENIYSIKVVGFPKGASSVLLRRVILSKYIFFYFVSIRVKARFTLGYTFLEHIVP